MAGISSSRGRCSLRRLPRLPEQPLPLHARHAPPQARVGHRRLGSSRRGGLAIWGSLCPSGEEPGAVAIQRLGGSLRLHPGPDGGGQGGRALQQAADHPTPSGPCGCRGSSARPGFPTPERDPITKSTHRTRASTPETPEPAGVRPAGFEGVSCVMMATAPGWRLRRLGPRAHWPSCHGKEGIALPQKKRPGPLSRRQRLECPPFRIRPLRWGGEADGRRGTLRDRGTEPTTGRTRVRGRDFP